MLIDIRPTVRGPAPALFIAKCTEQAPWSHAIDVLERKQVALQGQLVERERLAAIGTTAAKFAHEVANPLNSMLVNLQLARRRVKRGVAVEELAPLLGRVENQIHRLTALLREFRGMSCRQEFQFRPTAPSHLLEELVDEYQEEWSRRSVTLECQWPEGLPSVPMDEPKMAQVLSNLCKNAVEAMDEGGGTLTLSARVVGDMLCITVADTGCGIPADFDPYAAFATTKAGGTGLGLPVVRYMIHAHGGELHHQSIPGKGSSFFVTLPLGSGFVAPSDEVRSSKPAGRLTCAAVVPEATRKVALCGTLGRGPRQRPS